MKGKRMIKCDKYDFELLNESKDPHIPVLEMCVVVRGTYDAMAERCRNGKDKSNLKKFFKEILCEALDCDAIYKEEEGSVN